MGQGLRRSVDVGGWYSPRNKGAGDSLEGWEGEAIMGCCSIVVLSPLCALGLGLVVWFIRILGGSDEWRLKMRRRMYRWGNLMALEVARN